MVYYNSRDSQFKSPFGAVRQNEQVSLHIHVPRDYGCKKPKLLLFEEDCKQVLKQYDMAYSSEKGEYRIYSLAFSQNEPALYWYAFELDTVWGPRYPDKKGNILLELNNSCFHQLTVYSRNLKACTRLRGGIMYQIFPDRFFFSGKEKEDVPEGRVIRYDLEGIPEYRPNSEGEVLNNDYFRGDLKGIERKLFYLKTLGVNSIYLNPIFEAHSNHRYNTADYLKIDPLLGTEEDFRSLCERAEDLGIRIILDGVFSHTGSDSVYFNRNNRYPTLGAYNSPESPYYSWYKFRKYPDDYQSWWGIDTLPEVIEENPDFLEFITGEDGVLAHWMKAGVFGYRLDVADELPDVFLDAVGQRVKEVNEDSIIIGEVWEDASNKISYGQRRRYLLGGQLDTVMNYPFKDAIIDFLLHGDGQLFADRIWTILENYPKPCVDILMNSLSTHDTARIMTVLAAPQPDSLSKDEQAGYVLNPQQYAHGKMLYRQALVLQFFLPGIPCIYYGDEIGMYGYRDPFARRYFTWDRIDGELLSFVQSLAVIRQTHDLLADARWVPLFFDASVVLFSRERDGQILFAGVNLGETDRWIRLGMDLTDLTIYFGDKNENTINIPTHGYFVGYLEEQEEEDLDI